MHSSASDLSALLGSDLTLCGWNGAVVPYPGQSPKQFAMSALYRSIVKKFHNDETDVERDAAALKLFLEVNERCKGWQPDPAKQSVLDAIAIGEAKVFIDQFCHPTECEYELAKAHNSLLDERTSTSRTPTHKVSEMLPYEPLLLNLSAIRRGFGWGNGANIGSPNTDWYSKLCLSTLSSSKTGLYELFVHSTVGSAHWPEIISYRTKFRGTEIVPGSRLSFVPKSSEISRTICTEPVLNMMFQKGIAWVIEQRLIEFVGIELKSQPDKNRELARIGSLTGKFGTIDLSSASDSLSLGVIKEFFPPSFYNWLMKTRCDYTILPDGSKVELHMVSSMGNAFTFPLQTLLFASLVYGAYRAYGIKPEYPRGRHLGNFAVFGDDIIVDSRAYDLVVRMLSHLGFKVNVDKSFNEGLFRESCGLDYFSGHNVRGVYVQKLLDDRDFYSAINRLNRWCARHGIFLPNTIAWLQSRCKQFLFIPNDEADDAGIKVPASFLLSRPKGKWPGSITYRFLKPKVVLVRIPNEDSLHSQRKRKRAIVAIQRRIPGWYYNPAGLLFVMLHGSLRNGYIGLRVNTRHAVLSTGCSSRWDYNPYALSESEGYVEDWKVFTSLQLVSCRFSPP
jgi:hypothetical protein